jgi:diadenylate cyclase
MLELWSAVQAALSKVTFVTVFDIALVAVLIYQFAINVRGRRAAQILLGLFILLGVYVAAQRLGLDLLSALLSTMAPYTAFALIVLFQSEIRRVLARIGRRRLLGFDDRLERRESADEILLAIQYLSQHSTGALIVVERDIGLRTFVETGVVMDAQLSRDLLLSIFYPNSPLHDGAVILQGDRVAAAACFLPLTLNPQVMNTMGTRHRAAIGITEETDCLALVVSEETGKISYAAGGEIFSGVAVEEIQAQLTGRKRRSRAARPSPAGVTVKR